jgi:hypothetical protein
VTPDDSGDVGKHLLHRSLPFRSRTIHLLTDQRVLIGLELNIAFSAFAPSTGG